MPNEYIDNADKNINFNHITLWSKQSNLAGRMRT